MDSHPLSSALAACVSPMLLVSGVGLILMTVGNRLSHTIDRIRKLDDAMDAPGADRPGKLKQLRLLYGRARLLQASIACVVSSILSSSLIVFGLFGIYFWGLPLESVVTALFAVSLCFIIASALLLLVDASRALVAIRLEIGEHLDPGGEPL